MAKTKLQVYERSALTGRRTTVESRQLSAPAGALVYQVVTVNTSEEYNDWGLEGAPNPIFATVEGAKTWVSFDLAEDDNYACPVEMDWWSAGAAFPEGTLETWSKAAGLRYYIVPSTIEE